MRAFSFTLFAILGYVAVMDANPLVFHAPAEAVDRPDPLYCDTYPDVTGCSTACRVNPLQQRCRDLCGKYLFPFCSGAPPPVCLVGIGGHCMPFDRRQFPYCDDHPDAPGCGGSDAPSCDVDPYQPSCLDLCNEDPELSFCMSSGATPPAGPAPDKAIDRR